jgi:L-amino acid N-acyltransferase YncA
VVLVTTAGRRYPARMTVRTARPDEDAASIAAIYAPIVAATTISFELEPPSVDEISKRIETTLPLLPWLVSIDAAGRVEGYVYASRHRDRAAYQWAVDVSAYVREDSRGRGLGKLLYGQLFELLVGLGYFQACAGIALPNAASVALHESVGFRPVGVYPAIGHKFGAWHDVGWWQKALQPPLSAPAAPRIYAHGAAS